ncbi:MAG: glycosyl transferase family 1 [Acidiphilium sp. 37-67-22]|nr:MAG: glycosyl transferase family 1 [Acidiphilium sp. 37-67-22]HQT74178.1 glycosyltransferase [Acidiphilium sp.]
MRILTWQWGRRGAGPRFAALLHTALGRLPATESVLSLSAEAEILGAADAPDCAWRYPTYSSAAGALARLATLPFAGRGVRAGLARIAPDAALCAMPAVLDRLMVANLRVPYGIIVHDAVSHPGESLSFRLVNQARLLRSAGLLVTLSQAVTDELHESGAVRPGLRVLTLTLPPMPVGDGAMPAAPFAHGGRPRLLMFGRLLPYKGLDLLCEAMERLGPDPGFGLHVAGNGPDSAELSRLAAMPHVTLDRRWIPEAELSRLIGDADALVLPYRQASQSGVAAAALALGRQVIATEVGGLAEQLRDAPQAILCPPDAGALAAALRRWCARRDAGEMGTAADPVAAWTAMAAQLRAGLGAISGAA